MEIFIYYDFNSGNYRIRKSTSNDSTHDLILNEITLEDSQEIEQLFQEINSREHIIKDGNYEGVKRVKITTQEFSKLQSYSHKNE